MENGLIGLGDGDGGHIRQSLEAMYSTQHVVLRTIQMHGRYYCKCGPRLSEHQVVESRQKTRQETLAGAAGQ